MIYIIIFIVILIMLLFPTNQVQNRYFYFATLFAIFIFTAFRWKVGCDWSGYLNQYNIQASGSYSSAFDRRDPLWWVLLNIQHQLKLPYPWINVHSSFMFFVGLNAIALRQQDPLAFLVLCFPILIINMPMTAIRQGSAIGFVCLAYAKFIDHKQFMYCIYVIIGSMLHSSAFVFMLLAPFASGSFSEKRVVLAGILLIPGIYGITTTSQADLALNRYVNSDVESYGALYRTSFLAATSIFFYIAASRPWLRAFPHDHKLALVGAFAMLIVFAILPFSTVIPDRMGYYLIPIQSMIFARLTKLNLGTFKRIYCTTPYAVLILMFSYWTYNSRHFSSCYIPYQSWLLDIFIITY